MRDFIHRFFTDLRWFLGTVSILLFMYMFVWRIVDHDGFVEAINGFFHDMWEIVKGIGVLCLIIAGIGIMFGWRPFKAKKGGH